ncbi:MAG TPA: four-carbon acid sugar kinase family protein [Actinomycetota bacterium]
MEIGVLADDLTGALASATRLRSSGLHPRVHWYREEAPAEADALVVDMRTRDGGSEPADQARTWGSRLRATGCRRYELRIDSTLRGAAGDELRGLLEGTGLTDAWVLAVPAFPDAGRTTVDGVQRVAGTEGDLGIDVGERIFGANGSAVIGRGEIESGGERVLAFMHRQARRGTRHFVADATHDLHLSELAGAAGLVEDEGTDLVTASPGAWLRFHPVRAARSGRDPERAARRPGFVLVVLSSPSATNRAQLDELVSVEQPIVLGVEDASREVTEGIPSPRLIVVETIRSADPAPERVAAHAEAAASAAASLMDRLRGQEEPCAGVIVSGGHAAACLAEALGARGIEAETETRPLCGTGTLVGGAWDGLRIVTKGGLVGDPSTLRELVASLRGDRADG